MKFHVGGLGVCALFVPEIAVFVLEVAVLVVIGAAWVEDSALPISRISQLKKMERRF